MTADAPARQRRGVPRLVILVIGVVLVVGGGFFGFRFAQRSLDSYRAMQFAREHDFDSGNLDVALLRPWMNMRYIAEAYAVPQVFLFEELGVPMEPASSRLPLDRLNHHMRLDRVNGEPELVERVREAIEKYRSAPVVTGLAEGRVEHWMNMQYIANSTGIPVEDLFDAVGIPAEGHGYMPLGWLVDQTGYEPGLRQLLESLQRVVDEQGARPE